MPHPSSVPKPYFPSGPNGQPGREFVRPIAAVADPCATDNGDEQPALRSPSCGDERAHAEGVKSLFFFEISTPRGAPVPEAIMFK